MSDDSTVSQRFEVLRRAHARGDLSEEAFCEGVYALLQRFCAGCRETGPLPDVVHLDRLSPGIENELRALEAEVAGEDGFDAAFGLVVAGGLDQFVSDSLAAAIVIKARNELPEDPRRSGQWAALAAAVAGKGRTSAHRERLAQALAYIGNTHRASQTGGLVTAEPWLNSARVLLGSGANISEAVADIWRIEGTLRKDQRQFSVATHLLRKALGVYLSLDLRDLAASTLLSLAHAHYFAGELDEAIDTVRAAFASASALGNEAVKLYALVNLAVYSELNDDVVTARQALDAAMTRIDLIIGPLLKHRLAWIDAVLHVREGRAETLKSLWDQLDQWLEQGASYDAVALLLDIGRLAQARQDRPELERVATALDGLRTAAPEHHVEARHLLATLRRRVLAASLTRSVLLTAIASFRSAGQGDCESGGGGCGK